MIDKPIAKVNKDKKINTDKDGLKFPDMLMIHR